MNVSDASSLTAGDRKGASSAPAGAEAKNPSPAPASSTPGTVAAQCWTAVCRLERLQPERGVAALVDGEPVAVFRTHDGVVRALHNVDPFSRASVLARGIVGDIGGTPVVASPVYKQHFALDSGRCLEEPSIGVAAYPVRVHDGTVEIGSPRSR